MKKTITLFFCFTLLCSLTPGCMPVSKDQAIGQSGLDNAGLLVKINVKKLDASFDCCSPVTPNNKFVISQCFQEERKDGSVLTSILEFSADDIKMLSAKNYFMKYRLSLKVPLKQGGKGNAIQYNDIGSVSAVNAELGKPICLFADSAYTITMTVDIMK